LLRRATRIAEIESVSSPGAPGHARTLPSVGEMPTTVSATAPEPTGESPDGPMSDGRSDVSSIAVSPILPAVPRRKGSRAALLATTATVGAVLLVAFGLLLGLHRSGEPTPAITPAPPLPAAELPALPSAEAPDPAGGASASAPLAVAAEPSASAESPPPASSPVAPPFATATHRLFAPAARPEPRRAAAPDCDPPFTIDAVGHKHFKPACLQ
ncbi:MAG: hypothetical protein ACRELB_09850, partial [Polyangiaceae bacterium]